MNGADAYSARQDAARARAAAARERDGQGAGLDPDEAAYFDAQAAANDHQGTIRSRNAARAEVERLRPIVEARRAATAPDPIEQAMNAESAYDRRTHIRNLDDAQVSQLMVKVAMDRDHPNRRSLMSAINKENDRRAEARMAAADAKRAAERAEREAVMATPERKAAALAERLRDAPDITPGANHAPSFYAAGLQQAARSGTPRYYAVNRAKGVYEVTDTVPDPAATPAGYLQINPDGTATARGHDGTSSSKTMGFVAGATKAADAAAAQREADAREPVPRLVVGSAELVRTRGMAAALDAPDLGNDHVDTRGLHSGMRAEAHAALDAIARVHRVDEMPRYQTITEASSDANGSMVHGFAVGPRAAAAYRAQGLPDSMATDEPIIMLNPNGQHAAFTFAHEYGHALDRYGLIRENSGEMATYAVSPDEGDHYSQAVRRRLEADGAVPEFEAVAAFVAAARDSATIQAGSSYRDQATQNNGETSYLAYRNRPDEMWARAYSQFIAVRSGEPALLAGLRHDQETDAKPGKLPMQWPDDEFERDIAPAVEAVLRARGWMD